MTSDLSRISRASGGPTIKPEEEQFLKDQRFCVISTIRKSGTPTATPAYYLFEDGKLIISVTKTRAKTAHVRRDPRVCVCVLHEEYPFPYVEVTGRAVITEEDLEDKTRRIFASFTDHIPTPEVMKAEQRVLMVITPEEVFSRIQVRRHTDPSSPVF